MEKGQVEAEVVRHRDAGGQPLPALALQRLLPRRLVAGQAIGSLEAQRGHHPVPAGHGDPILPQRLPSWHREDGIP